MKNVAGFIVFLLVVFAATIPLYAQDSHTTDTDRKWYYPDHMVVQFAGNIGLLSAGPGYSYLKDMVNSDILYGFVPGFQSGTSMHIFTIKTSYRPWNLKLNENYMMEPLKVGTGFSYSFGSEFYTKLPSRYPKDYYWWATSLRLTPFIGSTISRKVGNAGTVIKRVELYGEIGTTDLDLVSKFSNKDLSVWDILNFAIGTKLVF